MAGNVWEWTRSLWGKDSGDPEFKYPYDPEDGRENLKAPKEICRVLRGGTFHFNPNLVRGAVRGRGNPDHWHNHRGFRVVVSPLTLTSETLKFWLQIFGASTQIRHNSDKPPQIIIDRLACLEQYSDSA